VGLLQGAVQLRLTRGQRNVRAQLPDEFAIRTAECSWLAPGRDQDAEDAALGLQRRGDQRTQAPAREPLRERKVDRLHIRLVNKLALHATRQPVLVDFD